MLFTKTFEIQKVKISSLFFGLIEVKNGYYVYIYDH